MSQSKKRFVAVGTGARIPMFIDPIVSEYSGDCEIAAFCDLSRVRMEFHRNRLAETYGHTAEIKLYHADDFDRMLDEVRPDTVIVCTVDSTHHDYVIRSLEKGCDVICEKPLTVDAEKCLAILKTVERTGRRVCVTFNLRWTPGCTKVRELIMNGVIGRVKQVTMEYMLDTSHGADYFRRWHSHKKNSGGLLVHKSTHHFDLVNWWVDGIPKTVYAAGDLAFYGRGNAVARGDEALARHARSTESTPEADPFFYNIDAPGIRELYRAAEAETGYIRDRNVFREGIDIEDAMAVIVRYRHGVTLNYSLNAFCPREGFRVSITGDRGRIEYEELRPYPASFGESGGVPEPDTSGNTRRLLVMPLFGRAYEVKIPFLEGGHGGGDVMLKDQVFSRNGSNDAYGRSAGPGQGAASALIGIAANRSIETGLPVHINDLVCLRPAAHRLGDLI